MSIFVKMYALLCKPVAVAVHNKLQVTARDCRMIKIVPSRCEENAFEMLDAPPITISTKSYNMKKPKKNIMLTKPFKKTTD